MRKGWENTWGSKIDAKYKDWNGETAKTDRFEEVSEPESYAGVA